MSMATSKAAGMSFEEWVEWNNSEVKRLSDAADAALFDLHRHIELQYKDEAWREVYGARLMLGRVEAQIQFRHFMKATEPKVREEANDDQ